MVSATDIFRSVFVDKIFKGAKPADRDGTFPSWSLVGFNYSLGIPT
jgi:hypothetical protein